MRWIFLVKNKHVEQLLIMKNGLDTKNKEEKEREKKFVSCGAFISLLD